MNWFFKPRQDHDLSNNLKGPGAGSWAHSTVCPFCKNSIDHEEFMTDICLSCGKAVSSCFQWKAAATRRVFTGGRWTKQRRIDNIDYLGDGQVWGQVK